MKSISQSVGKNGVNSKKDIESILYLLAERKQDSCYRSKISNLKIPHLSSANLVEEITECIKFFQKSIQNLNNPDGLVSPNGTTILFLGGVRAQGKQIILLGRH